MPILATIPLMGLVTLLLGLLCAMLILDGMALRAKPG